MKVLVIGGISRSLVNFRGPLIRAMRAHGHEVIACSGDPREPALRLLKQWGVTYHPVNLARAGVNPVADIRTAVQIFRLLRRYRPDCVLTYTIKPVIWGGLAARAAGVPAIYSMITGLGYAFIEADAATAVPPAVRRGASFKKRTVGGIARRLYRQGLRYSRKVFFQNPDDRRDFISMGMVRPDHCFLVSGSGVDVDHYRVAPLPPLPVFLLIGRLLVDKGVREYAAALQVLRNDGATPRALLVGLSDSNPTAITASELDSWVQAGFVDYRGHLDDVRPAIAESSVYVLPSYREGTPRTVLEAMATGRPIITTDAPGCRETVRFQTEDGRLKTEDRRQQTADLKSATKNQERSEAPARNLRIGLNGILIPPRDSEALAAAMRFFIDHPEQIAIMGRESRHYAEERYDVHKVNAVMLKEMGL